MVGALDGEAGLTPRLDALVERAEWSSRAIAPSTWAVPALASLATGLRPWQHQALTPRSATVASELTTLAEALSGEGFTAAAFGEGRWFSHGNGHDQGFASFQALRSGRPAERFLRALTGEPVFVWIQLPEPRVPYGGSFGDPVEELGLDQLAPYFNPDRELTPELRERLADRYRYDVARVDTQLGRLLAALTESGQREKTLLAVVSAFGQHLGEENRVLDGGVLSRAVLEVPMVLDLPEGFRRLPIPPSGTRVASARTWATLVDAAGGVVPPGVAPSLLNTGAEDGILSELYAAGGSNRLSWLEGDTQLRHTTWFAAVGEGFFGGRPYQLDPRHGVGASSPRAFGRHYRAFLQSQPLGVDGAEVDLRLDRWGSTGTVEVEDPPLERALAAHLHRAWNRFVDAPRTAAAEAELRASK